jgi:AcrR family transcriptional regulator
MKVNRRSQVDRSAATRSALVGAARVLFAEHGFAGVGTEAIARAAGVTRGALYHQFPDKTELFAAVYEQLEESIVARLAERIAGSGVFDPLDVMRLGAEAWLDACADPEVEQIVLLDGPSVLGWQRWRDIGIRFGLGLVETVLADAIDKGRIASQPISPLAHALMGALDEAALYIACAEDRAVARAEMGQVVARLVSGLEAT